MFKKVAIFGLGLLGGSLCKAIKKIDPGVVIHAYGRDIKKLEPAFADGCVDMIGSLEDASLAGVNLAVVSMPVDVSIDVILKLMARDDIGDTALIIDVGSVKQEIIRSIEQTKRSGQFIGCHPMAGSEKMGYEYSRDDLYDGSSVIITPHRNNTIDDVGEIKEFWEELNTKVVICSPEEHDLIVSYTSHLPHIISSSLVRVFERFMQSHKTNVKIPSFIGKGFMDVTRISSGSPDMWYDIVQQNRENIMEAITKIIDELLELRHLVSDDSKDNRRLHEYFTEVKKTRDQLK